MPRPAPSRAWWAVVCAVLALAAPTGSAAQATRPPLPDERIDAPEIESLEIRGNEAVDDDELREIISTQETVCRNVLLKPICWISTSPYFHQKHYLDEEELARDVLRLRVYYWRLGYREAQVDTIVQGRGDDEVKVVFVIEEGPPVVIAKLVVTDPKGVLDERAISRAMQLRAGRPYSIPALDSSVILLKNALWEKGYADGNVAVAVDTLGPRTVALALDLDPGPLTTIEEIVIRGGENISERVIRNSLTFRPGDLYERSELITSQRHLYESNLFSHALIVVPPDQDSTKVVLVEVREAPLHETRLAAGFNTVDFVQADSRYRHYNFLGGARRLTLNGAVGNLLAEQLSGELFFRDVTERISGDPGPFLEPTWQVSAELTQRWFYSPRNAVSVSAFAHRRQAPDVFIDRAYGGSGTFTREFAPQWTASATYRFERTEVQAAEVYFCVYFAVCDNATIEALQALGRLSPLALTSTVDRTDDPFAPRRGYKARAELEHASRATFSSWRYNRAYFEGAAYRSVGRGRVLAGHVRLGWARALPSTREAFHLGETADPATTFDLLHPRKRFYAGGANSVRGFGENQLGQTLLTIPPSALDRICDLPDPATAEAVRACDPNGFGVDAEGDTARLAPEDFQLRARGGNTLVEGSVEYRFGLFGDFGAAVFLDGALVGGPSIEGLRSTTVAVTPGVGLRYQSPVGVIRFDIGYRPFQTDELPVFTEVPQDGRLEIVRLREPFDYHTPYGFLNRLVLHLAIGEVY